MSDNSSRVSKRRRVVTKSSAKATQGRDRWILSYADFITLLFAFFVALYSLSLKNSGDEARLKETLQGVFDAVQKSIKPINIGEPIIGEPKDTEMVEVKPIPAAIPTIEENTSSAVYSLLSQVVENQFSGLHATGQISVTESADWVSLELKSGLLFGQGEYELTNEAVALLILVADILKAYPSVILVEGNTDDLPVNSRRLVSNWHLSSLRSSSVVDELVYRGVNSEMIAPIGFSSEHPKVRNTNDYARQQNRRVILRISKRNADNLHDYLFQ
ncbi:MAG: OmpA family protein [Marinomonas foliarum]|uniref:Chemotaxis protein MotB n=1 Tax=Marinomonas foliarum TaxID=491950 RepID=A0A369AHI0_9GAMM|nr:OmpA family protein [Marinomonas foliarum]QRV23227.1 OmpA family protein [Marinomonas foliarum]RCX08820.1 chemotaxis protein MotB [Marinomonas foliarum]